MKSKWTAETWPIAAAMIPFPSILADGRSVQDSGADVWADSLTAVAQAGFNAVDPTDTWLRVADLDRNRRAELLETCEALGLSIPAISTSRRSVIDPVCGDEHLAYLHRLLDVAAEMGVGYVSFGLFGPLSDRQKKALWFWTEPGVRNPDDVGIYKKAVHRIRELGRHAGDLGIQVALELYEDTYLGSAKGAVRFATDVDHSSVKLNLDIGNLLRLHRQIEPWQEMIALCAPFAGYWHVKNYYRMEEPTTGQVMSHPAPLLGGTINWRLAICQALDLGFNSPFLVEHYGGDGLSICAQNRDYLRQILASRIG